MPVSTEHKQETFVLL